MDEDIDSILALIDELNAEEQATRLNAINHLEDIAKTIGPERTREELVPYISELLDTDSEEVLLAFAEKLGALSEFVGDPQHFECLITPLQALATNEERTIQFKATESLNRLASMCPLPYIQSIFLPLLQTMATSDFFTAKISACYLFHIPFQQLNSTQQEQLIRLFVNLAKDDTPMVRRAAAFNLAELIKCQPHPDLLALLPVFAKDPHDSVRLMCLDSLVNVLPEHLTLVSTIKLYAKDKSWRVRYALAEKFQEIFDSEGVATEFVGETLALLADTEAEVRSIALEKLQFLLEKIPEPLAASQVIPALENLGKDSSQYVRISLVQNVCVLSKFFGTERTLVSLLPLISQMVKDEIVDVRMSFPEHMEHLFETLGPENTVKYGVPLEVQLMEDLQWRVRTKAVEYIPQLAELIGEQKFSHSLGEKLVNMVEDPVFTVRETVLDVFKQLSTLLGSEWVKTRVNRLLQTLCSDPVFTKRMIAIRIVNKLAKVMPEKEFLGTLAQLAKDKVPNIRFSVAKCLHEMREFVLDTSSATEILQALKEDSDFDVRYFAEEASSVY